jgi:hypothetical protein
MRKTKPADGRYRAVADFDDAPVDVPVERPVDTGADGVFELVDMHVAQWRTGSSVAERELSVGLQGVRHRLGLHVEAYQEAVQRSIVAMLNDIAHVRAHVELRVVEEVVVAAEVDAAEDLRLVTGPEEGERASIRSAIADAADDRVEVQANLGVGAKAGEGQHRGYCKETQFHSVQTSKV